MPDASHVSVSFSGPATRAVVFGPSFILRLFFVQNILCSSLLLWWLLTFSPFLPASWDITLLFLPLHLVNHCGAESLCVYQQRCRKKKKKQPPCFSSPLFFPPSSLQSGLNSSELRSRDRKIVFTHSVDKRGSSQVFRVY